MAGGTRMALAAAALALLAGCGRDPAPATREPAPIKPANQAAEQVPAGAAAPAPGRAPARAIETAVQSGWQPVSGPGGEALVLFDTASRPVLSLTCRAGPARLEVAAERFTAIGSEERLTLGAGGEALALVADPTALRPAGVIARGPIEARLLDHLARTDEIGVSYGSQTFTHAAPPKPVLAAFRDACRRIGG